jgi:hypothetical protein
MASCFKRLSILLLFSAVACAQYIPVYAKLTDGTGNVSKTAYLHFELQNCGSNFPIVPGNSQVAPDGVRHQEICGGLASGLLPGDPPHTLAESVDRVGDGAVLVVLENSVRRICEAEAGSSQTCLGFPVLTA